MSSLKNDRIFNPDGWRHFRRTYSLAEVRIGLAILVLLIGFAVWVGWMGQNQDPELLSVDISLLAKGSAEDVPGDQPGFVRTTKSASNSKHGGAGDKASSEPDPVPTTLAAAGWSEQSRSRFGPENLYVKINGREGYYKSFGFQMLHFIALAHDEDEAATVDIEMYDHGTVANALGAYAGERQPDAQTKLTDAGIGHTARNATFLVRGKYYVRALGSDETDVIIKQLAHIESVLDAELPSEPLPWGYALFAGQMGVDPGTIKLTPENAYSFGFARGVFSVTLNEDGAEMFAVATDSSEQASALAKQFIDGFSSYGDAVDADDGVPWIKDQYLNNISGALAVRSMVIGVYSASDAAAAKTALAPLRKTAESLSNEFLERAAAEARAAAGSNNPDSDDYSDASDASDAPSKAGEGTKQGDGEDSDGDGAEGGMYDSEPTGEPDSPPGEEYTGDSVEEM